MTYASNARGNTDVRSTSGPSSPTAARQEQVAFSPSADAIADIGTSVARYGVAVILLSIGILKFTAAEANGIAPLVTSSPLLRWMYAVWSMQDASRVIGIIEIVAALGIALRALSRNAVIVGSALGVLTFLVTLSFFLTAPGVWDSSLGFPFLGGTGQFIVKDIVLLGACLWSLGESLATRSRQ
jgi:reactive chlorine resistance protein C